MKVRLYTLPASHPGMTAKRMLEHKGISYTRVDMLPGLSRYIVRALRFNEGTVPAMVIDGRRVQGSRTIAQELERLKPEPPLFPADADQRAAVVEVERWGDVELQDTARKIMLWAAARVPEARLSYLEEARIGLPHGVAAKTGGPLVSLAVRLNDATEENARAALAKLPAQLQRVDDEIAAGTIGGEKLNAADYQVGASMRLLLTSQDLRPMIDARPAGELARRAVPSFAGDLPPTIPESLLEPLRATAAA
ncbi:MAG TPA: glutathione S-transferase N-terminal domain-containing protein [Solirubrobacterales bacterium]|jgi:glutathione S-transferase|nr:glutathione S-transferase N-terminal domain-containing protein [Solirubrobacterales bacterium]